VITEYLTELLDSLDGVPSRHRRRILTEVEDHLLSAAAELHAAGLTVADAEHEALLRFGPATSLGRLFARQAADGAAARGARVALALALAVSWLSSPNNGVSTADLPLGLVPFISFQVALVAAGMTWLRAFRWQGCPDGAGRLLMRRGLTVVLGCAAVLGASEAVAIAGGARATWRDWIGLAAVGGLGGWCSWLRWRSRPADAARPGPLRVDPIGDLVAAGELLQRRLVRRWPVLGRPHLWLRGALLRLAAGVSRRRRLARWLDLNHHPWRFAAAAGWFAGSA
jgi:hypothetical protein